MTLASRLTTALLLIAFAMQPVMACWMNATSAVNPALYQSSAGTGSDPAASSSASKTTTSETTPNHQAAVDVAPENAESLPCHNAADSANLAHSGASHQILEAIPCVLCSDCDTTAQLIQSADGEQLLPNPSSDNLPPASLLASDSQIGRTLIVRILGPPEEPRLERSTPITLKQRLLV